MILSKNYSASTDITILTYITVPHLDKNSILEKMTLLMMLLNLNSISRHIAQAKDSKDKKQKH